MPVHHARAGVLGETQQNVTGCENVVSEQGNPDGSTYRELTVIEQGHQDLTILDKLRVERVLHYLVFVLLEQKLDGCPVVFVGRLAQAKESKDVVEPRSLLNALGKVVCPRLD